MKFLKKELGLTKHDIIVGALEGVVFVFFSLAIYFTLTICAKN